MIKVVRPRSPHPFASNTYILSSGEECCIIDPTVPYSGDLIKGKLKYIILTHCHFDHILELDSWVNNTKAELLVSPEAGKGLADPFVNCSAYFMSSAKGYFGQYSEIHDGDEMFLGNDKMKIVSCPGHTAGSISIICENMAFVGDTVFAGGGYGRCDLPGGDSDKLTDSINKILSLPEDTVLYCGHGPQTTVKEFSLAYKS